MAFAYVALVGLALLAVFCGPVRARAGRGWPHAPGRCSSFARRRAPGHAALRLRRRGRLRFHARAVAFKVASLVASSRRSRRPSPARRASRRGPRRATIWLAALAFERELARGGGFVAQTAISDVWCRCCFRIGRGRRRQSRRRCPPSSSGRHDERAAAASSAPCGRRAARRCARGLVVKPVHEDDGRQGGLGAYRVHERPHRRAPFSRGARRPGPPTASACAVPRRRRRDLIAHRADVAAARLMVPSGVGRPRAASGEADARRRDVEARAGLRVLRERPRSGAREDGHRCGYYGAIIVRHGGLLSLSRAAAHGCSNCCWCQMMSCVKQGGARRLVHSP